MSVNPIPLHSLPGFHESSPLRSPRDGDAVTRQWAKNRDVTRQVGHLAQNLHLAQRQIDRLRRRRGGSADVTSFFPFKIMPSPAMTAEQRLRYTAVVDGGTGEKGSEPLTADLTWRSFRVRAGVIGNTYTDYVMGTDGANSNPDDPAVNPTPDWSDSLDAGGAIDFVVPDDTYPYFVYADRATSPPTWYIMVGTVAKDWGNGDYILLATIDTHTYTSSQVAVVRQLVRTDLMEPVVVCSPYA